MNNELEKMVDDDFDQTEMEKGEVYFENNQMSVKVDDIKSPIMIIPREDMPSMPFQYTHSPNLIHMENMDWAIKFNRKCLNDQYNAYVYDLIEQCIDIINQNAIVLYTSGILSILGRFSNSNSYAEHFIDTHTKFFNDRRLSLRQSIYAFVGDIINNLGNQDFFIYYMAKIKSDFSRVENDFLNHVMTDIFGKNMVDTYGFSCYVASLSNINVEDDNLGFNKGTALSFALNGSAEFTKYDAARINEAVELNLVSMFYRCLDVIHNNNIKPPVTPELKDECKFPKAKRVDIIDEELLKQILEDDDIEEENLG